MTRAFTAIALLALVATQARAADLRVPAGVMLCHTLEAAANPSHPGCWLSRGGQRVEIVASMPHYAQLRIWSSDGSESMIAYGLRADADRIQSQEMN